MGVYIDEKLCKHCKECVGLSFCPMGVYSKNEKTQKTEIDNEKCVECGLCVNSCPNGAIKFKED